MRCCVECRHVENATTCTVCTGRTVTLSVQSSELLNTENELKVRMTSTATGWRAPASVIIVSAGTLATLIIGAILLDLDARDDSATNTAVALAIVALAAWTLIAILVGFLRVALHKRKAKHVELSAVRLGAPRIVDGAEPIEGVVRRLGSDVGSFEDGEACLVTEVAATRKSGVVLWASRSVDFELERDDQDESAARTIVSGVIRLQLDPHPAADRERLLDLLEVPKSLPIDAQIHTRTLRAGDRVRVIGVADREHDPRLATGYRDAGEAIAVRGSPDATVCIEPA